MQLPSGRSPFSTVIFPHFGRRPSYVSLPTYESLQASAAGRFTSLANRTAINSCARVCILSSLFLSGYRIRLDIYMAPKAYSDSYPMGITHNGIWLR